MNVLCVAAHPDDETLGAGGTLARHAAAGDDVTVLILSDGVTSRHEERTQEVEREIERRQDRARRACDALGVNSVSFRSFPDNQFDTVPLLDLVQAVEAEIDATAADVIYTHHHGDLNVDHELTARAVLTAARPLPATSIDCVLSFEVPSSSEWGRPDAVDAFQPTTFVDIEPHLEDKLRAFGAYEDELRGPPHPRSVEHVERLARTWGAKSGLGAAEPYELLRAVRRA